MRLDLDEINKDIIEKIDSLETEDNIKDFLKTALSMEYHNRDENYTLKEKKDSGYEILIAKFYKGD